MGSNSFLNCLFLNVFIIKVITNSKLLGLGMRVALEMVASVIVGGAIGWYIDRLFDTKPWFFLVFLLLGITAGLKSVLKIIKILEIENKNK